MPEILQQLTDWFVQLQLIWILLGALKVALIAVLLVLAWRYPKTLFVAMILGLTAAAVALAHV
jgi:hypothetical protein